MPRGKKKAVTDTKGIRDIEAYTHDDKKRTNNPPAGMAQHDTAPETKKTYAFDPHLDPILDWAGKKEGLSFDVPTSSIHIHEKVTPEKIIASIRNASSNEYDGETPGQMGLFDTAEDRRRKRQFALEAYKHGVDWSNRLIAGDSLVIMNSLIEKEGMSGQVQMVYIDPPYGIKYASNFQPFVDKRDVKDKDEDLTKEPETVKAFRDTWELGIHSYLTYLRNRLMLARELLADSGGVFIQISEDNLHYARVILDEIFGRENFIAQITFRKKKMPLGAKYLEYFCDYLLLYAKNCNNLKFHNLFTHKNVENDSKWCFVELIDGTRRRLTKSEHDNHKLLPAGAKVYLRQLITPAGYNQSGIFPVNIDGKTINPPSGKSWKTSKDGMDKLLKANRVELSEDGITLNYVLYLDDYPVTPLNSLWANTSGAHNQQYVVETSPGIVKRCILMTTDPGDLVLDITCGSGTTAYVAEQWGRRWITCDTSRVALTLAKKRMMTASYDYYKLAHEESGVSGGFIYKTVPHITLKSIANNEPPATETLYDQPEIDKTKIRISGPFTVEALPAPVGGAVNALPLGEATAAYSDYSAKQTDWREELLATGILGRGGTKIDFSRVEPLSGTVYLHADAETKEETPRRAVVCFASETKPLDSRMVDLALDEAVKQLPKPSLVVFAAFQFDPEAAKMIDEMNWPGVTLLKVQMNPDLMTDDLKKKRTSNQSFWLVGQPDVELIKIEKGKDKGKYQVCVNGFDYYNVKTGKVESGNTSDISMWSLDTDYDGMALEPVQVFFTVGDGWEKLAKNLKAEINQDLIRNYTGYKSFPFEIKENALIAVKIIDRCAVESMRVLKVGGLS